MPDPRVNPELLRAIVSAQSMAQANDVAQQVIAHAPPVASDEDDILDALKKHFATTGQFWKSKKFWMTVLTTVSPVILQLATGAVTWPVAVGGAVVSGIVYVLSQGGVDKATATALGNVAQQAIVTKMGKK